MLTKGGNQFEKRPFRKKTYFDIFVYTLSETTLENSKTR